MAGRSRDTRQMAQGAGGRWDAPRDKRRWDSQPESSSTHQREETEKWDSDSWNRTAHQYNHDKRQRSGNRWDPGGRTDSAHRWGAAERMESGKQWGASPNIQPDLDKRAEYSPELDCKYEASDKSGYGQSYLVQRQASDGTRWERSPGAEGKWGLTPEERGQYDGKQGSGERRNIRGRWDSGEKLETDWRSGDDRTSTLVEKVTTSESFDYGGDKSSPSLHIGEKRKTFDTIDNEPHKKKMEFSMSMTKGFVQESVKPASKFTMSFGGSSSSAPKISMNLSGTTLGKKPVAPIKMSLGVNKPKAVQPQTLSKPRLGAAAAAFADEDESDDEDMPPEARMRMRNVGRETPTAAGPNSFGKGNLGFCDRQKIIQRELQKKMDDDDAKK